MMDEESAKGHDELLKEALMESPRAGLFMQCHAVLEKARELFPEAHVVSVGVTNTASGDLIEMFVVTIKDAPEDITGRFPSADGAIKHLEERKAAMDAAAVQEQPSESKPKKKTGKKGA